MLNTTQLKGAVKPTRGPKKSMKDTSAITSPTPEKDIPRTDVACYACDVATQTSKKKKKLVCNIL